MYSLINISKYKKYIEFFSTAKFDMEKNMEKIIFLVPFPYIYIYKEKKLFDIYLVLLNAVCQVLFAIIW